MPKNSSGQYNAPASSWSPATNGNLALAGDWNSLLADISSALTDSLSRNGNGGMNSNLAMSNNKITGLAAGTGSGDAVAWQQLFQGGTMADIASAATVDIGVQNTSFLRMTGTTTITSFGANYRGPRFITFEGAVTLTNSSTLVLPGGANITTAAGDTLIVIPGATAGTADKWVVVAYQKNAVPISAETVTAQIDSRTGTAGGLGFRNRLINANPIINQRGYVSGTATTTANQYTLDRWRVVVSGQSVSWTDSGLTRTVTCPAGGFEQVIESLNIEGGTFVLNWTGTATATVNGTAVAKGGTFTLPANTNATVRFSGGTLAEPQLEAGSVATPFERRPYGTELALCERYYEVCAGGSMTSINTAGLFIAAAVNFRQTKRATPTVVRLSDVNTENVETPFAEAVSVEGFRAVARVASNNSAKFQTRYAAVIEL